jgi:hypothetical protein
MTVKKGIQNQIAEDSEDDEMKISHETTTAFKLASDFLEKMEESSEN